ncbi:MAG: hypothetical protein KJO79_07505 [Verrucomicrobiae bacterium]|nr:hypothetical protein [Verrucomicrobiae bacterium]NNJ87009.1 hypothetical protein [Akkermansiaceae bacterium]
MDLDQLEQLKITLAKLTHQEQDYLSSFLLVERLKRNQLVMPAIHQRIEDADPENWQSWDKTKDNLDDA